MRSKRPSRSVAGAGVTCRHGFALLMMLGLLGVVASALVALTTLAVRESALQSQQMAYREARENAQLALLEALGILQAQAGRDAAITARAQMLGSDPDSGVSRAATHAQAWTGVWRADAAQAKPYWLVSGNGDPTAALATDSGVTLVAERHAMEADQESAAPAWEAVRVPLVSFEGGAYAWWVGDEGVKVNVAAPYANRLAAQAWLQQSLEQLEIGRLATLLPGPSVNTVLPQVRVAMVAQAGAGQGALMARAVANTPEADDAQDAALRAQILDITALAELAEGRPAAAHGYSSDLFHEVTFGSHGVLADPLSGLRTDYSQAPQDFPLGGEFAQYADYSSAMETPATQQGERSKFIPVKNDLRRRYHMRPASSALVTGEVSAAIAPVLTDCYMVFNVHKVAQNDIEKLDRNDPNKPSEAQRNRVMIHAGLLVELWNPYTSALVPQDLLLEVEGLPERVLMHPQGTGAATVQVPLAASLRNGASNSKSWWIELPFTDKEYPGKEPTWFPGRVYNWTGPNNYADAEDKSIRGMGSSVGNFYHRHLDEGIWAQLANAVYPTPRTGAAPEFRLELREKTSLTIRLRIKSRDKSQRASAPVLAEIRNVEFERMPVTSESFSAEHLRYQFGFRVRLEDPGSVSSGGSSAPWEKSQWLRRADPRDASPAGDRVGTGSPVGNLSYYVPSRQPREHVHQTGTGKGIIGSALPAELWNRPMGDDGVLQLEDAPLFELPRQDLLRVADLRHLHLVGLRPYSIGNRWGAQAGNDVNRVFDLGFFSGLRASGKTPLLFAGDALPNERLLSSVEYPQLREAGGSAAAHLLLHGAFNINTTSEIAWRAVLAGALYDQFDYIYSDPRDGEFSRQRPTRTAQLGRAVARYAQSAAETFDVGDYRSSKYFKGGALHDPAVEPPTAYFRRGLTELSPEHLDLLARNVSRRIASRAAEGLPPFHSFADFLGPQLLGSFRHPQESGAYMSVLEAAVYDTMLDASLPLKQRLNRDTSGDIIWWDTPSFVNGGDLWAQFAHYAAVRSDTFRVRAYGRSLNGTGGIAAEAWCEVLVQRLPQLHGKDASIQNSAELRTANTDFGREFRVVSMRWLRPHEL